MSYGKRRNARLRRKRFDARVWIMNTLKETYLEGYKEGWNDHAAEQHMKIYEAIKKSIVETREILLSTNEAIRREEEG